MINNLPQNWELKTLGEIAEISSGGTPSRTNKDYWENGTIAWVKIADMKDKYLKNTAEKITELGLKNSSTKVFQKGTLLYSIFATLGRTCILDIEATTNQAIAGIIPKDSDINILYLMYFLQSIEKMVCNMGRGATQNNINLSILKQIQIPLPPLEIQKQIVEKLEKAFTHIDKATNHLKAVKEDIPRLKASLLKDAFSGKLTYCHCEGQNDVKNFSHCEHLQNVKQSKKLDNGLLRYTPNDNVNQRENPALATTELFYNDKEAKLNKSNSLNNEALPQGWELKTLGEVCTSKNSNIVLGNIENNTGKYPIYGAKGFLKNIDFYTMENESLGIVKDGAGVGRIFLLPEKSSVIGTMAYIQANENLALKYLYYFLQTINFNQYISGSAIPHIYFKDYKKEKIPLPPLETQKQIVQILESKFSHLENLSEFVENSLQDLKKLKSSFLNQAFKGELIC